MEQWEMKVGERAGGQAMMEVPPWPSMDEFDVFSPQTMRELAFFTKQRYLPSNDPPPLDAYSCDEFRMFDFKVRRCGRGRSHDWTECPFAHPGEKARRRDPRKFRYSGTPCPDFRKGGCNKGDSCEHAHGVFESWLHPTRYRTQACKDGTACRRRVCFFAHTPEQLRPLPSYPNSRLEEAVMEDGRVSPDFGWVWELVK